ncbi:iron complex outermembrane recepter protein [Hymenobacter gelipurpurascens]|uniref:Iron complex outermembrane recepter protein n=1 Tax=Hymenobacter gelipurpurascens TaxID=89968 RepID=A0A212UAZ4_9BACT|nr:TonB-dependent receptor [Hymenobacter gelipurpurascens]SNC75214.1 iron complex outermembrane recepter protein [Hymenobacter gelipurpurascens]
MQKLLLFPAVAFALVSQAQAQNTTVTGRVVDSNGTAQPGVTILERGTSNGTSTDASGRFSLSVPPTATLVISAVGSATQQIPLNGRSTIDVRLVDNETALNEVVVTGSRASEGRSNIQTTSPVDVISAREIKVFAQTDVSQILTYIAPSFQSSRQAISDGTDHVDPASLRGLGPDQVLVLVNGKRRHSSALVNINGTVGRGSVGTDLNTIPNASIKRIEVLRDGAAAQYGSDAIAGVINIQLKDDTTGVQASTTIGETYKGDGELYQADANVGIGLNGRGYLDLSGQFSNRSYTNRTGEDTAPLIYLGGNSGNYPSSANTEQLRRNLKAQDDALVAQNSYYRKNLRLGQSEARNYGGFLNFGYKVLPAIGLEAYATAGAMQRTGKAAGFYRLPNQITQTDATLYPNGFLPFINTLINDQSIITGLRARALGFDIDLSNTFGRNEIRFDISNTLNASLPVGLSPTNFYAGTIAFRQNTSNLNFTRRFTNVAALSTLNVAFGAEYRDDNYQIRAGERGSYENYGRIITPGTPPTFAAAGAQVFPGYQPSDALNRSRHNVAGYVDLESDITENFLVGIAGRAEDYSDFGSNVSGKLAARYNILPDFAVRGALSNGFRAPSLQQRYFTNTSTQFVQGAPNQVLTVSNDDQIVRNGFTSGGTGQQGFGVAALKQEKSTNYSLGLTARILKSGTVTVDAYQIDIKDRIVLSSQFSRANATVNQILGTLPVSQVQFFANAVNTRTRGIDIVANQRMLLGPGNLSLTVAANFNETEVRKVNSSPTIDADQTGLQNTLFDRQQRGRLETAQPRSKINLTAGYSLGIFSVEARTVRFGAVQYKDARLGSPAGNPNFLYSSIDQTFSAKWITDLTLSAQVSKQIGLTIGANNIFNVYPDKFKVDPRNSATNFSVDPLLNYNSSLDNTNRGRTIYNPNQFGYNGGFYFARLIVNLPTSN